MPSLRVMLLTLESPLSRAATAAFVRQHAGLIVGIGASDPCRASAGGHLTQLRRHWRRSGPRLLPFLALNYALPAPRGSSLACLAQDHAIPLHAMADINGAAAHALLRRLRPDLIVSLHFDQILTAETLALARLGGINLHPSLLPRHRGPLPAFWAMAEGNAATGVSIHRMTPRIDAGAVLAQQGVSLPPGATVSAATRRLHMAGVALLSRLVTTISQDEAWLDAHQTQPAEELPYCPFPSPAQLAAAARQGLRLVDLADLRAALLA